MQKAIIVDLDGTLANIDHRIRLVREKPKNYEKFHSLMTEDKPNEWCTELIGAMRSQGVIVIFLTGRDEKWREETLDWFEKHNIDIDPKLLFMRPDRDYRSDFEVKEDFYKNEILDKYTVIFAIDDREQVANMWRRLGLVCLHCDTGN